MKFTSDSIHHPYKDADWNRTLKLSTSESVKTVIMRLPVKHSTRFSEITVKPMVGHFRIHWFGLWQWKNVGIDCSFAVQGASDETRHRKQRNILFSYSEDDRCGIRGNYKGAQEDSKEELTMASGTWINLELQLRATRPWKGYIEFSNTPLEGVRYFIRRRVIVE